MSVVLAAYGAHTLTRKGLTGLGTSFSLQAERYPTKPGDRNGKERELLTHKRAFNQHEESRNQPYDTKVHDKS